MLVQVVDLIRRRIFARLIVLGHRIIRFLFDDMVDFFLVDERQSDSRDQQDERQEDEDEELKDKKKLITRHVHTYRT